MPEFLPDWLSLVPPLAAIVLAIATRRVILSLLAGVFTGALIMAAGEAPWAVPLVAVWDTLETHLWPNLIDGDHVRVFAFTSLMGAMVGVIQRSRGMIGIVEILRPLARSRRGGQLTVWLMGLVIFFDDYANTLLLGHTMRPLADRLRISREKLAYLVDSTAAPVAGMVPVSTWVATEIAFIATGFVQLSDSGVQVDAFAIFIASIPYRFYVIWALLLVPMVALLGRDFGPMRKAEERQQREAISSSDGDPPPQKVGALPYLWINAVVPVGVMLAVVAGLLVFTGLAAVGESKELRATPINVIGNADSYIALLYGALAGLLTAAAVSLGRRALSASEIRAAAVEGASHVVPALLILWFAWSLSGLTGEDYLGTQQYLGTVLQQSIAIELMPTLVFVLAGLVAFATGTSWGTMAVLMPLAIGVVYNMQGGDGDPQSTIMIATIGSVLAGAIFGDHCSPISDTTVLSSQASGCDHVAHVWTQMPYALLVGAVSVLFGTLPVGLGVSVWLLLPLGTAALVVCLLLLGRRVVEKPTIDANSM